jgi:hypothetical protein
VTGRLRRLVGLAVTLAPSRATRLAGRLTDPQAAEALQLTAALAGAPRRVRLAALAAALSADAAERPAAGPLPEHPLLRRIAREGRASAAVERTLVRAPAGAGRLPEPDHGPLPPA